MHMVAGGLIWAAIAALLVLGKPAAPKGPQGSKAPASVSYCHSNAVGFGVPCRDFDAITGHQQDL